MINRRDKRTGEIVALKVIDIDSTEDDLQEIQQEVTFQSHCNDEHITRYFGSYIKGNELWIAMEFLGGGSVADIVSIIFGLSRNNGGVETNNLLVIAEGDLNS